MAVIDGSRWVTGLAGSWVWSVSGASESNITFASTINSVNISSMWTSQRDYLKPAGTLRLRFSYGDDHLSYGDFLHALAEDPSFRELIQDEMRAAPFGAFHRSAPHAQQHAFWITVARTVLARLGPQPLWLSTAGGTAVISPGLQPGSQSRHHSHLLPGSPESFPGSSLRSACLPWVCG